MPCLLPETLPSKQTRAKKRLKSSYNLQSSEKNFLATLPAKTEKSPIDSFSDDWPVGPPGYGFPKELAHLDSLLIRASGDGTTCAAGFRSDLACFAGECPPGLFCDPAIDRCCPLLLPLSSARTHHTSPRKSRITPPPRPTYVFNQYLQSVQKTPPPSSFPSSLVFPPFRQSYSFPFNTSSRPFQQRRYQQSGLCNGIGCGDGNIIDIPPEGGSLCILVCPRGYDSCCSRGCCKRSCPDNSQPTGRCFSSCPSGGSCIDGLCCPDPESNSYSSPLNNCPNGGYSIGNCGFGGSCSPGYSCIQNNCCPQYAAQLVSYTCPGGGSPVGNCVNNGCASGYTCSNNYCCPTQNPFVCVDGTQAVGACVNGNCGTGYTCSNGLCCSTSSATPRCLDGSPAVGACIPSCTGDMCGSVQVTFSCGAGYTCTTGNICCQVSTCPLGGTSIGPAVNGLCPSGYTLQGNQCCSVSGLCPANTVFIGQAVNGVCPTGTLTNGVCCSTVVSCAASVSNGPCNADNSCPTLGYQCDTTNQYCCPVVDFNTASNIIGPAIGGLCPSGYTMVMTPNGGADGECVSLQSIPGICAESAQSGPCNAGTCPTGFSCFTLADVCCPTARAMHRMPTSLGRPLSHLAPSRLMGTGCPDGSPATSACINGLCGAGLTCVNDVCCTMNESSQQPKSLCPDGHPAVSGCFADGQCGGGLVCVANVKLCCPASSIPATPAPSNVFFRTKPIGARCEHHAQCVGHAEGLSSCDFGICRCTPIAFTQGIACVRRKKL